MIRILALWLMLIWAALAPATAQQDQRQEVVWVQIEAHPSLATAQGRAQVYAGALADVVGFSLGGSWYAILLGPYLRDDAEQVLRVYRDEGQIPRDSYIVSTASLGQQYWPQGVDLLNRGAIAAPAPAPAAPALATPSPAPRNADETPAQARRGEQLLTARERRELQTALKWSGHYFAAIDGAFGRGTRQSMASWQAANGFEPTGVLTTLQRRALMDQYNAPLISAGMAPVTDAQAGIAMRLPMDLVAFSHYAPPFVHYDGVTGQAARVLLISQPGDGADLAGLYDVMQTLEIVPTTGARSLTGDRFTLEGRDARIVSYTEAALEGGQIKGFTLVWPVADEDRRQRVLAAMRDSFERRPGVLDPAAGAGAVQDIDLVSGLRVRKPRLSRSGFFVTPTGIVVTTTEAVQNCGRVTIAEDHEARIDARDDALGLALLRPVAPIAPVAVATLASSDARLQSEVAVAGYSFEGLLGAPTLTFGTLADIRGLRGEPELARLALSAEPGDRGGPVFDRLGRVVGMLRPLPEGPQRLPEGVSLVTKSQPIRAWLEAAGLRLTAAPAESASLAPEDLGRLATGMTVLVSCWD